jgi:hypothetical protein
LCWLCLALPQVITALRDKQKEIRAAFQLKWEEFKKADRAWKGWYAEQRKKRCAGVVGLLLVVVVLLRQRVDLERVCWYCGVPAVMLLLCGTAVWHPCHRSVAVDWQAGRTTIGVLYLLMGVAPALPHLPLQG